MKPPLLFLVGYLLSVTALRSADAPMVTNLMGQAIDPIANSDTRAVVLFFVAADCPISNRYAPVIQKIATQFSSPSLTFWLVYPDRKITGATAQKHGEVYHLTVPALLDPRLDLARRAGVTTTPEVAVYAPRQTNPWIYRGRIDNRYESFSEVRAAPTTHDLIDTLTALLSGHMPEPRSTEAVGCYLDL